MKNAKFKQNISQIFMIFITAILITITGILFHQSLLRILPLYISLFVGMLQSKANRFASLIGGLNSLLYMMTYIYLGLYASAAYALLFSFPIQVATFVCWSKKKYGQSTLFKKLSVKARICVTVSFFFLFIALYFVLKSSGSNYQMLDSISSLIGILTSVLTMLAFIEYTWLMLPSGVISIVLNLVTMDAHPEQITYLIFSIYSMICVTIQFLKVRKLYLEQRDLNYSKL